MFVFLVRDWGVDIGVEVVLIRQVRIEVDVDMYLVGSVRGDGAELDVGHSSV